MKRTPLRRKTPLKAKTGLRRTPMKPWRRKPEDKMTGDVHAEIIARDGACFVWAFIDKSHRCATTGGFEHAPDAWMFLTAEHVKVHHRLGKRGLSRVETGVALCGRANVAVPSQVIRDKMRDRLASLYPAFWEAARAEG